MDSLSSRRKELTKQLEKDKVTLKKDVKKLGTLAKILGKPKHLLAYTALGLLGVLLASFFFSKKSKQNNKKGKKKKKNDTKTSLLHIIAENIVHILTGIIQDEIKKRKKSKQDT